VGDNIIFCFILLEIRPLPRSSPKEREIEQRINDVSVEIEGSFLFPIIYPHKSRFYFERLGSKMTDIELTKYKVCAKEH